MVNKFNVEIMKIGLRMSMVKIKVIFSLFYLKNNSIKTRMHNRIGT